MGVVYLIIFLFILIIAFENYEVLSQTISLKFNFIFAQYETTRLPYGIWLIVIFFLGYIVAYSKSVTYRIKYLAKSNELSKLKKQMKQEEKEKEKETTTIEESPKEEETTIEESPDEGRVNK